MSCTPDNQFRNGLLMFGVSVTVIDPCSVRQGTIMRSASVVCLRVGRNSFIWLA